MELTNNELFKTLVNEAELGVIVTQADDGLIIYVNQAYADNSERTIDELIGQQVTAVGVWPSEELRLEWRERVLRDGQATQRFDFILPSGKAGASTLLTQHVDIDDVSYFVSYNIDVSSIVDAEREKEEVLNRLNRAYEMADMADFVYSAATGHITGSRQFEKILHIPDGNIGIPVEQYVANLHPEDRDIVREVLNSDPDTFRFNARYRVGDDQQVWIETIGSVVRNANGEMTHWEGSIQNVTERHRAEAERQQLERKIQDAQKLESLAMLAGGVAHDFNNLLVGIMGNADFALMEDGLPDNLRRRLEDIVTASQRAADLTNQLLAYSGKGKFVIEPTDLSALVHEMSKLLNVSISKSCKMTLALADRLPMISADQTQIRQVVMNLIINASEAIEHDDGEIVVSTVVTDCNDTFLAESGLAEQLTPGEYVCLEIADNGCGMSEETQIRLFEPFFTTKFTGRGLGMSAVLGIVRGHQGAVQIRSEPDRGTTFKIFFPAQPTDVAEQLSTSAIPKTALVVDHDPMIAELLSNALTKLGFNVVVCEHTENLLEQSVDHSDTLSLVILDLSMPDLDAEQALTQLRGLDAAARVVVMSGYSEHKNADHWLGLGFDGYLQKPFRLAALTELVNQVAG